MSAAPDTWALIGTLDTQLTNSAQQRESIRQALAAMADLPDTVRRDLIAALAAKLEQPAPTGELTDVHVSLAKAALYRNWPSLKSWPVLELLNRVAQLLATREAAAYERGLSTRGEWVAVGPESLPDSDDVVVLTNERLGWQCTVVGALELTDDNSGNGEPYWSTTTGDAALGVYTHYRVISPLPKPPEGRKL